MESDSTRDTSTYSWSTYSPPNMVTVVLEVKHCEGPARHCDHVRHDGLLQSGVGEGTMVRALSPPTCDSLTTLATATLRTMTGQ